MIEQYEQYGGLSEKRISTKTRSAAMGQQAVTVLFSKERGFTREVLESVERKLILAGRHTYLLEEEADSDPAVLWEVIRHLNSAGIVVLFLEAGQSDPASFADRTNHRIVYLKDEKDDESIVAFVKNVSEYDAHLYDALYI